MSSRAAYNGSAPLNPIPVGFPEASTIHTCARRKAKGRMASARREFVAVEEGILLTHCCDSLSRTSWPRHTKDYGRYKTISVESAD